MITTINGKTEVHSPVFVTAQARQDQLAYTLRELRRRFGEGVLMQLGRQPAWTWRLSPPAFLSWVRRWV